MTEGMSSEQTERKKPPPPAGTPPSQREDKDIKTEGDESAGELKGVDSTEKAWGSWCEPTYEGFRVRSKTYLTDSVKCASAPYLFTLEHVEMINTKGAAINNICAREGCWFQTTAHKRDDFYFVVNVQLAAIGCNAVCYHKMSQKEEDKDDLAFFHEITKDASNKELLDSRFKLIPRITKGPTVVKWAVKECPVIMGNKVPQQYHRGDNYFEVDVAADSSYVSAGIVKLAHGYSKQLVVDMSWLLQANTQEELPERLLSGVRWIHIDFAKGDLLPDLAGSGGVTPERVATPPGQEGGALVKEMEQLEVVGDEDWNPDDD